MTTRTQFMTMFEAWGVEAAKAAIETERGLGNKFAQCVKQLLSDNPKATPGQLVAEYDVAIEALETAAKELLVEFFDEKATLTRHLPEFKNYKSAYRSILLKMGGEAATLEKFGPYHVKQKLAELNKKSPEEQPDNKGPGSNADTDGGDGSSNAKSGGSDGGDTGKKHTGLPGSVQKKIDKAVMALQMMSEADALAVATNFESAAWKSLRTGNRKAATTTKVAA